MIHLTQTTAKAYLQAGAACVFIGPPGTGKTAWCKAICEELGYGYLAVVLAHKEGTDIGGLPYVDAEGYTRFAKPTLLRDIESACAAHSKALLVLDEVSSCRPDVQLLVQELLWARKLGDHDLPSNLVIWGTANPPEMAADGREFADSLASRVTCFEWVPSPKEVQAVFSPKGPCGHYPHAPQLMQFLQQFSNHCCENPVRNESGALPGAWANPRNWERCLMVLPHLTSQQAISLHCTRTVGQRAGVEFAEFLQRGAVNLDDLLQNAIFPSSAEEACRIADRLGQYAIDNPKLAQSIYDYLLAMGTKHGGDTVYGGLNAMLTSVAASRFQRDPDREELAGVYLTPEK